jgi:pectin methylesterase-like acyl-CoA thioesterase
MKNLLLLICFSVIITVNVSAQFPASATWELNATTMTGVSTSGSVIGVEETFKNMEINQYTGPLATQRVRIVGNAWPASQTTQIDTVFIQFTVFSKSPYDFSVNSISLGLGANGGNSMRANVACSTDSTFGTSTQIYAATSALSTSSLTTITNAPTIVVSSGQKFYLRIYPWYHNLTSSLTGKYICPDSVVISGTTNGSSISLPEISTKSITNISTTFAVSGGTIPTDGGGTISARGVCWDTSAAPTITKNKSIDGIGSGSFVSVATNLLPGKTYFARAYATNSAGTAYGSELSFTTLLTKSVPTVTTSATANILATTANSGGNVTAWGGDSVSARGVCWSTISNPTIADTKTSNGIGSGAFSSVLVNLTPNTKYYIRAYAINNLGTGYGNEVTFSTQPLSPDVTKIVDKNGGDYTTVQAAFDAVPDNYTGKYFIFVKKGIYKEKLLLSQNKVNVILIGEDRDSTILTYDDYAGKSGGTSTSQSVAIDADDFIAMNITFQNTIKNDGTFADQQAVALRVNGDRQAYYNCNLLGYQDTYYTWGGRGIGRTYHKNCTIEGSVDFIFGRNIVLFDSCEIRVNRNNGTLTAAATEAFAKFGYVFINSKITTYTTGFDGTAISTFALGRPWQSAPRTVFLNTEQPANLNPAGWLAWNVPPALYAEYKCSGPGFLPAQRVTWSSQLSDSAASTYTIANIFSKNSVNPAFGSDWIPSRPSVSFPTSLEGRFDREIPNEFYLGQNFPNPFNPSSIIQFRVKDEGLTTLKVFNALGQEMALLFSSIAIPEILYSVEFTAHSLSSGMYFSVLENNGQRKTKKMLLLQ